MTAPGNAAEPDPADVTVVSADDVRVNRRRGGEMRVLLSPVTVRSTSGFLGTLDLAPGEYVSEHLHPYSEEFLYVTAGRGRLRLGGPDGTYRTLETGQAIMVPIGLRHRLENTGDEPLTAVFHLSPLAPRPDLGHVDTEEPPRAAEPQPAIATPADGTGGGS